MHLISIALFKASYLFLCLLFSLLFLFLLFAFQLSIPFLLLRQQLPNINSSLHINPGIITERKEKVR